MFRYLVRDSVISEIQNLPLLGEDPKEIVSLLHYCFETANPKLKKPKLKEISVTHFNTGELKVAVLAIDEYIRNVNSHPYIRPLSPTEKTPTLWLTSSYGSPSHGFDELKLTINKLNIFLENPKHNNEHFKMFIGPILRDMLVVFQTTVE